MIRSFVHKGLSELWETNRTSRIDKRFHELILRRLDSLNEVTDLLDLASLPGYDFHALKGFKPARYTIHVNGPWCLTFEFTNGEVERIDFVQYH